MPKFRPRHLITGIEIIGLALILSIAIMITDLVVDPALPLSARIFAGTLLAIVLAGGYYSYLRRWLTLWRQKEHRRIYRALERWLDANPHGQTWLTPGDDVMLIARKQGWTLNAIAQLHRSDIDAPQIDAEHGVLTWREYTLTSEYPHITRNTQGTLFTLDDDEGIVIPDETTPNSRWKAARAEIWATRRGANAASIEELRALITDIQRAQPTD